MKKILFLIINFQICSLFLHTQTLEDNLKKYWYLRDRLEQSYIILGSPEKQGTNLPASSRHYCNYSGMHWGQNPILFDWFPYVSVLATEYRLLKDYGQDQTAAETLQKLIYTLAAFDRLDANAEKFFRARNAELKENDPYFWTKVEQYKYNSDFNGFFLRCDVVGKILQITNGGNTDLHNENDTTDDEYIGMTYNSNKDIVLYNNSQLKTDDLKYNSSNSDAINEVDKLDSQFNLAGRVKNRNLTVMSADEVIALYLALAFVYKYVDDNTLFTDTQGNRVTARQWARNIAIRETNFLNDNLFQIINPINDGLVIGHSLFEYSYPIKRIMNQIFGCNYKIHNLEKYTYYNFLAGYFNLKSGSNNGSLTFLISAISGLTTDDFTNTQNRLAFYQYAMRNYSHQYKKFRGEFLPIFYSLFNSSYPLNKWNDKLNQYGSFSIENFKTEIENILNEVPECGLYAKVNHQFNYWYTSRILPRPQRMPQATIVGWEENYGNNLEYMFLHNLYWLVFVKQYNNSSLYISTNYPDDHNLGTNRYPLTFRDNNIIANNKIYKKNNSHIGKIKYSATNSITLKPGFVVNNGATFRAQIEKTNNTPYQYIYYRPACEYILTHRDKSIKQIDSLVVDNEVNNFSSLIDTNKDFNLNQQEIECNSNEIPSTSLLNVYPTITSSIVNIDLAENKTYTCIVYDSQGQQIFKNNFCSYQQIDFRYYSSGIYFLCILIDNSFFNFKIIKL